MLLALVVVLSGVLLAMSLHLAPMSASKAATSSFPVNMSNVGQGDVLSSPVGVAAVHNGGSDARDAFENFTSDGAMVGAAPFTNLLSNNDASSAVDAAGNVFTFTSTALSSQVNAFSVTGKALWPPVGLTTNCPSSGQPTQVWPTSPPTIAADGNLYLTAQGWCDGNVYYLEKILVSDGTIVFQRQLIQPGDLYPYADGLVLYVPNQAVQYLGFDGNIKTQVPVTGTDYTDSALGADYTGKVVIDFLTYDNSICSSWQGPRTERIVTYGPSGVVFSYTPSSCRYDNQAAVTPQGNVVVRGWSIDHNLSLTALDAAGHLVTQNTYEYDAYHGDARIVADTNGHVLLSKRYIQPTNSWHGWSFQLMNSDLSQVATFDTNQLDGNDQDGFDNLYYGLASNRLYLAADHCTQPGCQRFLYAEDMAGLGFDYPRGVNFSAKPVVCPSVQFIGARGSGETANDYNGLGITAATVKDELAKQVIGMGVKAVDYPAVPVFKGGAFDYLAKDYLESYNEGVVGLTNYVYGFAKACPNTYLILAGYSQGAHVVGDAFGLITAFPKVARMVLAVVMFGDPRFNPKQNKMDAGTYSKSFSGSSVAFGTPVRQIPTQFQKVVHSYCLFGDPVCNLSAPNLLLCVSGSSLTCAHLWYASGGWAKIAADWALKLVPSPIRK